MLSYHDEEIKTALAAGALIEVHHD
jgi:hypothetical protein